MTGPTRNHIVSVRLNTEERERLSRLAEAAGCRPAEYLRRLLAAAPDSRGTGPAEASATATAWPVAT